LFMFPPRVSGVVFVWGFAGGFCPPRLFFVVLCWGAGGGGGGGRGGAWEVCRRMLAEQEHQQRRENSGGEQRNDDGAPCGTPAVSKSHRPTLPSGARKVEAELRDQNAITNARKGEITKTEPLS